jgi:glycosyltransferase involved in cell wall biosynthesis
MSGQRPQISVCVCTFRRPDQLERLLKRLAAQETGGLFSYSVVIADNDASQSAREVATRSAEAFESLHYCVEPEQNIALARNRAIAQADSDYVAFIDDDEFPVKDWLLTLFRAGKAFGADGVLGPVEPFFDVEPPAWVKAGRFFDRPRHETGFFIDWTEGRTGNLLFRRGILRDVAEPFRREFGSGGEDRDFFRRMIGLGKAFVWCDEAIAYEVVPPARWSRSVMLRRALLRGKMSLQHKREGADILKSLVAVGAYGLALPVMCVLGHHHVMKSLIRTCDHAGKLLAVMGIDPVREKYVQ